MEYQFNRDTTDDPFNLLGGITNLPSFGVHDALQTQTFRLNNTHVFSAALIDQLRISAGYLKQPRTILGDHGRRRACGSHDQFFASRSRDQSAAGAPEPQF